MAKRDTKEGTDTKTGLGVMFKGLSDLIERLGDLAEQGEELNQTKTKEGESPSGKPLRAVYGFSVKFGGGQEGMKVEPFGHTRASAPRNAPSRDKEKAAPVHEVREPMVDLFEEKDGVHLVAEMPGVAASDVKLEIKEDILILKAESGDKKYWKEMVLPRAYLRENASITCNNGMVEIWLK